MKFRKIPKRIIAIILFFLLFVVYKTFYSNTYNLKINSEPTDAKISVNNELTSIGIFEKRLNIGSYNILVEKEGFKSENQTINLNKNTELSIKLFPNPDNLIKEGKINILKSPPLVSTSTINNENIIGIDQTNGDLLRISDNNISEIYSGNIKDYHLQNNTVAILDDNNLNQIIVIDIQTLSRVNINLPDLYPIIAVAVSTNQQTIYFLAEFDINNKSPFLYSIPIQGGEPKKLTQTKALFLDLLPNDILVLFEEAHDLGKNTIHLFDTINESQLLNIKTDTYVPSPSASHLILLSEGHIQLLNLKDLNIKNFYSPGYFRATWKDENTIFVLKNDDKGINFTTLNIQDSQLNEFQPLLIDVFIKDLYGVVDNKIIFRSYDNQTYSLEIP